MSFINQFPYSDFHELNLDWIIRTVKALEAEMKDFKVINQMTFEGTWDITKQYKPYSIVFDYDSGYSYLSKRPVPSGVPISEPDYWFLVGPLIIDSQARTSIELILRFITNNYESGSIATAVRYAGDYVIANGELYKVTQTINIGEGYTEGYNVESTTVENMIDDRFPIGTSDIQDAAVNTAKIANGAITQAKLGQHIIYKENVASDKYIFIGDSFNADNHYSWGKKIVAKLGLTLGTNAWVVATPGGGMGNGLILPDVQTLANSMSSADKNSITKILMVFGANDWSQTDANINTGIVNLENYLVSHFPNAEITLVAAQWGYLNDTYRQGLLNAYNMYAISVKRIKFIDKQFILMLDPYFVETDMVHPTDDCTTNMAASLISILQGGSGWTKQYSGLRAAVDTSVSGASSGNIFFYGDITPAGTHIYRKNHDPITFSNGVTVGNTGIQLGVIDCTSDHSLNNFFQRNAEVDIVCKANWNNGSGWNYDIINGRLKIIKRSDNDHIWDVFFHNDTYRDGSYNIKIYNLYLKFDCLLDYTKT